MTAQTFVRNGALYLERCLRHLAEQGLDAAVIDHGSTDGTAEILERHRPHPVRDVLRVPYDGAFDLESMLRLQLAQAKKLDADWYVRVDVDEIPQSDRPGETLAAAVARVDAGGWEVVDFHEFVFIYETDDVSYCGTDYFETMLSYYHFAPVPNRLMRAFRAGLPVDCVADGGHTFPPGSVRLYPGSFPLRHYIALSRPHAEAKFLGRRFVPRNVSRGWHFNRVNLAASQFAAPPAGTLCRLAYAAAPLDASRPCARHFWQWGTDGVPRFRARAVEALSSVE